ncbi:hypothetical protein, variant [Fonticula alba]|uniref:Glycosyl transferase CAP10 domain-containing protein n=1 Tax=Fonticula alba TaxID=691883 RepID=A0A058ZEN4_FONAL|nr:hypothetical protein, variant [Fonticula alba]KCV72383.1 hypothetical protein, variant [Fonticula alba]|eukprot:XP_009493960.1 hypothetical protein, variant [Fonticula alba]
MLLPRSLRRLLPPAVLGLACLAVLYLLRGPPDGGPGAAGTGNDPAGLVSRSAAKDASAASRRAPFLLAAGGVVVDAGPDTSTGAGRAASHVQVIRFEFPAFGVRPPSFLDPLHRALFFQGEAPAASWRRATQLSCAAVGALGEGAAEAGRRLGGMPRGPGRPAGAPAPPPPLAPLPPVVWHAVGFDQWSGRPEDSLRGLTPAGRRGLTELCAAAANGPADDFFAGTSDPGLWIFHAPLHTTGRSSIRTNVPVGKCGPSTWGDFQHPLPVVPVAVDLRVPLGCMFQHLIDAGLPRLAMMAEFLPELGANELTVLTGEVPFAPHTATVNPGPTCTPGSARAGDLLWAGIGLAGPGRRLPSIRQSSAGLFPRAELEAVCVLPDLPEAHEAAAPAPPAPDSEGALFLAKEFVTFAEVPIWHPVLWWRIRGLLLRRARGFRPPGREGQWPDSPAPAGALPRHPDRLVFLQRATGAQNGRSLPNELAIWRMLEAEPWVRTYRHPDGSLHRVPLRPVFFEAGRATEDNPPPAPPGPSGAGSLLSAAPLFERAAVLLGPHGGAFYNMLLCPPGAAVIELMPAHHEFHLFPLLAGVLGHWHWWHAAGPGWLPATGPGGEAAPARDNALASVDTVRRLLLRALAEPVDWPPVPHPLDPLAAPEPSKSS